MAVERVVVEIHLGVEAEQIAIARHHQGIDFDQARVLGLEDARQIADHLDALLDLLALKAQREGDAASVKTGKARSWIDGQGDDFFRRLGRHFLDVHAAFG